MKANELMIEDWVMINPISYYQVEQIRIEFGELRIYLKGTEVFATENEIIPIPLTPEILEKNGFIRDMFYGEWQFDLDTFPFNFPFSVVQRKNNSWYLGREEIGIAHNREIIDISYVHELQHALRLCGIEKEIEL